MPVGVTAHGVPLTRIATSLGRAQVKNVVALGALQAATDLFPADTFLAAIRQALKGKAAMIALNEAAFEQGRVTTSAHHVWENGRSQKIVAPPPHNLRRTPRER